MENNEITGSDQMRLDVLYTFLSRENVENVSIWKKSSEKGTFYKVAFGDDFSFTTAVNLENALDDAHIEYEKSFDDNDGTVYIIRCTNG